MQDLRHQLKIDAQQHRAGLLQLALDGLIRSEAAAACGAAHFQQNGSAQLVLLIAVTSACMQPETQHSNWNQPTVHVYGSLFAYGSASVSLSASASITDLVSHSHAVSGSL